MENQSNVKFTVNDKDATLAYLAIENQILKKRVKSYKVEESLLTIITGLSLYMAMKAYKKQNNIMTRDEIGYGYNKRN